MARPSKPDLAAKILRYLRAKEAGKRGYAKADALLDELGKEMDPETPVRISESGKKAQLIDQFADKPIVWKPCGVRRWDIKVTET